MSEAFIAWTAPLEWLSDVETLDLPPWKMHTAFVVQFGVAAMGDGAGSLFYNHTERVEPVAEALDYFGEPALAEHIRAIDALLQPIYDEGAMDMQDKLIAACMHGDAVAPCAALDTLTNERWAPILEKLESQARAQGWTP